MHDFPQTLEKRARKIPPLYTEFCKRLWFWGKMSDFGAGACDFHSDFASDFHDFPGDFPGDFSSDFGGAPRTAKQPPVATETAPDEWA